MRTTLRSPPPWLSDMQNKIVISLDTIDPVEARLLVDYLTASDPARFAKTCLILGYLSASTTADPTPARAKTLDELEDS